MIRCRTANWKRPSKSLSLAPYVAALKRQLKLARKAGGVTHFYLFCSGLDILHCRTGSSRRRLSVVAGCEYLNILHCRKANRRASCNLSVTVYVATLDRKMRTSQRPPQDGQPGTEIYARLFSLPKTDWNIIAPCS